MDLADEKLITLTESEAHIEGIRDKFQDLSEKWSIQNKVRLISTLHL